jgi:hypothetical protein
VRVRPTGRVVVVDRVSAPPFPPGRFQLHPVVDAACSVRSGDEVVMVRPVWETVTDSVLDLTVVLVGGAV